MNSASQLFSITLIGKYTMALRNLVDAQCGEGNALVRLTHHVTKDKALVDEGLRWPKTQPFPQGKYL